MTSQPSLCLMSFPILLLCVLVAISATVSIAADVDDDNDFCNNNHDEKNLHRQTRCQLWLSGCFILTQVFAGLPLLQVAKRVNTS